MTASTCSLRSGHQSCIRAEFPSLQVFGSYVHLSLTRSSSSFVCCAFKPALWTAPCSSSTQPLMSSWSLGKKKKKTNPLQGAATMTEYVQVINPHYTTRSTGPISRGYVWGGCGRGGSALRYTQPMRAGGSAHNNREAVRVGTDTAHLQMGMK